MVAGVLLSHNKHSFADSKKLSVAKREELFRQIVSDHKLAVAFISAAEIDAMGLSAALRKAGRLIYDSFQGADVILDGKFNFVGARNVTTLVAADALVNQVSAASIVAKVLRDRYMRLLDLEVDFSRHVGYGTAEHQSALASVGLTIEHRMSYEPVRRIKNEHDQYRQGL